MNEAPQNPPKIPGPFAAYGGFSAVLHSKYFWISAVLLLPTFPLWSEKDWWIAPIAILPNILGFSLGAFALVVAFGDDRFRRVMMKAKKKGSQVSVHGSMAGTFYYFIFVQTVALLSALCCEAMWKGKIPLFLADIGPILGQAAYLVWPLCFFLFIYGVVLVVAAAGWMFTISLAFEADVTSRPRDSSNQGENKPKDEPLV